MPVFPDGDSRKAAMVHGIDPDSLVKEINDFLAKDLA